MKQMGLNLKSLNKSRAKSGILGMEGGRVTSSLECTGPSASVGMCARHARFALFRKPNVAAGTHIVAKACVPRLMATLWQESCHNGKKVAIMARKLP